MPFSGMWHRVDLVWADVSEERITSIFRVEKFASEEPAWAGVCSHLLFSSCTIDGFSRRAQLHEWVVMHSGGATAITIANCSFFFPSALSGEYWDSSSRWTMIASFLIRSNSMDLIRVSFEMHAVHTVSLTVYEQTNWQTVQQMHPPPLPLSLYGSAALWTLAAFSVS
jgi:hypothetical protein